MFREKLKLKVAENLHEARLYLRLPFPSVKQGMFILLWVSDNVRALYWGIDKYQQKQRQELDFSVEKIENSAEIIMFLPYQEVQKARCQVFNSFHPVHWHCYWIHPWKMTWVHERTHRFLVLK